MNRPTLLAVLPDGTATEIPNTCEAIKLALDGATMDFHQVGNGVGVYLDDNGKNDRLPLNVPVSLFAGEAIYGPCVVANAMPDEEGDTLPPSMQAVQWFKFTCERWNMVVVNIMVTCCGDPFTYANPDDMMGPIILTGDEIPAEYRWLFGEPEDGEGTG